MTARRASDDARSGSLATPPVVLLALLACALLLTACGSVPTSGPIQQGPVVDSGESTQFIRVIAAPPSPGASAAGIVRGFLEANPSFEHDHGIARGYLTQRAAQAWRPGAEVTVYDPDSLRLSTRGNRVDLEYATIGRLSAEGSLRVVDPAELESVTVAMEQISETGTKDRQWRISEPPDRLLISATDLRRAYRPYEVMFASDRSSALVPDTRLLPVVGASLATRLAQLVLAGPADWLSGAVHSGMPEGGRLATDAVPVLDGTARVSLSAEARAASGEQRRDLAAALTWTLTQLPDVEEVSLDVEGEPYPVGGVAADQRRSAWLSRSPDVAALGPGGERQPTVYVLAGSDLVRGSGSARTQVALDLPGAATLHALAVRADERGAAAIAGDASGVWMLPFDATAPTRVPLVGVRDLAADVDGGFLAVGADGISRILAEGDPQPVSVRQRRLGRVTALSVARDGARVAAVIAGRVYVGALTETPEGLAVESLRRADTESAKVTAVAWHDAQTLDVLGAPDAQGRAEVWRLWVGTTRLESLGSAGQATGLASAPSVMSLVATADARVLGNVGQQWRAWGLGQSVAYPG